MIDFNYLECFNDTNMSEAVSRIAPVEALTDPQAHEVAEKAPIAEGRNGANFMKIDIATDTFKNPGATEGQRLMAKMLVKAKGDGALEARPAGFAIGFTSEPSAIWTSAHKTLVDTGAMVFTAPLLDAKGTTCYVGVDKNGVFIIRPPRKTQNEVFLEGMRNAFNRVGNQETNFISKIGSPREWPKEKVAIENVPAKSAELFVQHAASESAKAPFISTADASKSQQLEQQTSEQFTSSPKPLGEISF